MIGAWPLAVVTGANQGLGLETSRQLAKLGYAVVLTSRDRSRGERAARGLGGKVESHELDVTRKDSIASLASSLADKRFQIDALVNNAGGSFDGFNTDVARRTIDTNVYGALDVTDALRPLFADTARIVMVSSGMGELSCLGPKLRQRFSDPGLGREELRELTDSFVQAVERGDFQRQGWPANAYRVSKAALNALTRILARELAPTSRQCGLPGVGAYPHGRFVGGAQRRGRRQGDRLGRDSAAGRSERWLFPGWSTHRLVTATDSSY